LALDGGEWSVSCPCCFTPRERKNLESNLENGGAGSGSLSNDQKTICPQKYEHNGRNEVVYHLAVKLPRQTYHKALFPIARKVSPVTVSSSKKKRLITFSSKCTTHLPSLNHAHVQ
jgi:hypothetical protein